MIYMNKIKIYAVMYNDSLEDNITVLWCFVIKTKEVTVKLYVNWHPLSEK